MDKNNKRVALVTGAIGGLGTSMCRRLFEDGYHVIANFRNQAKADAWLASEKQAGYTYTQAKADVASYTEVGEMVAEIEKEVGPIDVLVNNAGITRDGVLRKMTPEAWDEVLKSNLYSVFNCSRHVLNGMLERGFGRIINISSVNGQRGQVGQTNYSAAKAGMHGFTKSLAMEVANKGITVNTISPGYILTDMVKAIPEEIIKEKILPGVPMGRLGGTEEVASLVSFLVSDKASFITGANYAINGGQHVY